MATESITKNFIVEGEEDVKMFLDAIESSINDNRRRDDVSVTKINSFEELEELCKKRKALYE